MTDITGAKTRRENIALTFEVVLYKGAVESCLLMVCSRLVALYCKNLCWNQPSSSFKVEIEKAEEETKESEYTAYNEKNEQTRKPFANICRSLD